MIKVGVTGGIGSGKSTVCKIFEALDVPVFYSDIVAIRLYTEDDEVINSIKSWYGRDIYSKENALDRKKLASIIYNDPFELDRVNALLHPKVRHGFSIWASKFDNKPYVINESALLYETRIASQFEIVVNVAAPLELRINRIIARDSRTRSEVLSISQKQFSEEQRKNAADYTIVNDETVLLIPQVLAVHQMILAGIQS